VTRVLRLTSVIVGAALLVAGCGADTAEPDAPARGPALAGDFSGSGPGTLVAANTLPDLDPRLREDSSVAARITYVSTSGISDSHPQVSGTVFVPKGTPPQGGWPIVAFGHPATGIESECAPSASPTLLGSVPTVTALLDAGYVVAMSDYQGLGLRDTYHPFLDSTTEGYNLIDSVRAARKLVPTASDGWVAYGVGQGGQAAWAADELTPDYRGGLNFLGAVAVTPTAALDEMADDAANGSLTRAQQFTLQQFLQSLKEEYDDFDLDAYRHGKAKDDWTALTSCWGPAGLDRDRVAGQIGPDDMRPDGPDATEVLRGYLQKTSLPQAPTAAPMLVVPDAPDGLIPEDRTATAVARACAMGDVIELTSPQGGDPTTLLRWMNDRVNAVPAQNDCATITSTQPPPPTP
jgi:pimeloyl-ACP methyl ester carboxylesterase